MQTIHASIDDKTRRELDKIAEQESRTRSSLIAMILRLFVASRKAKSK